jgi:Flp pilus assembly pilin Flp
MTNLNLLEGLSMEFVRKFLKDETGVTAAEYGMILGCLAAIMLLGIGAFYTGLGEVFTDWANWFKGRPAPTGP